MALFHRRIGMGRLGRARRPLMRGTAVFAGVLAAPVLCAVILRYLCGNLFLSLDALFGLQPLRLLLLCPGMLVCLILWGRGPRVFWWVAVACELILGVEAYRGLPFRGREAVPDGASALRVFTQNVNQEEPGPWTAWIQEYKPDIACFQEIYTENLPAWKEMAQAAGYKVHFQLVRKDAGMGSLILCRFPLDPCEPVEVWSHGGDKRWFAHARTQWNGGPLDIFSVHLESAPRKGGVGGFLRSWGIRAGQAETVAQAVESCSGNVVVAGDCNATPTDRSIRALHRSLQDAWIGGGRGIGGTWPARHPVLRIDTIWSRGFAGAAAGRVVKTAFSDHDGVAIRLFAGGSRKER